MSLAPPSLRPPMQLQPAAARPSRRAFSTLIRASNADGPLRRPSAPSLSPPPSTTSTQAPPLSPPPASPVKPVPPTPTPQVPAGAVAVEAPVKGMVTLEYQRKVAKELQEFFRKKKLEEAEQGPVFGFVSKNEIANGRWAMFGFAVGMLTEYATGSDFVQQLKILLSNFGIADLD